MADDGVNPANYSAYYEIMHTIIPRFLRVIGRRSAEAKEEIRLKLGAKLGSKENLLHVVEWFSSADFFSLPGYLPINELEPSSIGLFAVDIASACAVNALGIKGTNNSLKIIDLCCCPGGKTQMIYDALENHRGPDNHARGSKQLIVGVDVSKPRLQVCLSLLDRTARYKDSVKKAVCGDMKVKGGSIPLGNLLQTDSTTEGPSHTAFVGAVTDSAAPRLLLFNCDGTTFGMKGFGSLVFDSHLREDEMRFHHEKEKREQIWRLRKNESCVQTSDGHQASMHTSSNGEDVGRKRKNKSARQREQKRLRCIEENDLPLIFKPLSGDVVQDGNHTVTNAVEAETTEVTVGMEAQEDTSASRPPPCTTKNEIELDACFDYVLVDAECLHDGSYRHMRYVTNDPIAHPGTDAGADVHDDASPDTGTSVSMSVSVTGSLNSGSDVTHTSRGRKAGAAKAFTAADADREEIVMLQRKLILNGFRLLKATNSSTCDTNSYNSFTDTATMVYSTCSLDVNQNEGVVEWLLQTCSDAELCPLQLSDLSGTSSTSTSPIPIDQCQEDSGADLLSHLSACSSLRLDTQTLSNAEQHTDSAVGVDSDLTHALSLLSLSPLEMVAAVDASKACTPLFGLTFAPSLSFSLSLICIIYIIDSSTALLSSSSLFSVCIAELHLHGYLHPPVQWAVCVRHRRP